MPASVTAGGDPRRALLLALFAAGLAAVHGRTRMRQALAARTDLDRAWLLAVGKAAAAMTRGALDALGPRIERALVVTPAGSLDAALVSDPRARCIAAGHPHPDAASLAAGEAALAMARAARPGQPVLLLVSGGASSLLEAPADGVALEDLRRVSGWALASGEPIARVNAVRRRLSQVKDGRLLARLAHCRVEGYFISDVPHDDPALVGSGLLARSAAPLQADGLPAWLRELVARVPVPDAQCREVPLSCVGRLDEALDAVARAAATAGLAVMRPAGRLEGDATEAARQCCERLAAGPQGLLLLGGETTVVLPDPPGRGGRNQHLALAAALRLEGRDDLLLLAAGSDGVDGNSADAGALVDGGTSARGRDGGLDPRRCLARADSGRFLQASRDLVHTGATGTNVGDLLLALRRDPGHGLPGGVSM